MSYDTRIPQPGPLPSRTEADAVANIIEKSARAHVFRQEQIEVPTLLVGKTGEIKSLEHLLPYPVRKRAQVKVQDCESFIAYVKAYQEPGTVIFARVSESGGGFTAILDYHQSNRPMIPTPAAGEEQPPTSTPPHPAQWGEHVCDYICEFTPEWKRWSEASGKALTQAAMAQFIEENMFDIEDPAPAQMLEMVKTLEATQGVQFKSSIRLENGDRQLAYAVETGAKAGQRGDLTVPQRFLLRFAIFTGGLRYHIECRFRYAIDNGQLRLEVAIVKPHKLVECALADAKDTIRTELGLPVLLGSATVLKC